MSNISGLLLVGHGRMGRLVEAHCGEYGFRVAAILDRAAADRAPGQRVHSWDGIDVAIDFSTPSALLTHLPLVCDAGVDLVIGTTGLDDDRAAIRERTERAGIGVVLAPNFSIGANVLEALTATAARLFRAQPTYGAWLHEMHHAAKRDAPSGTAKLLVRAMEDADYRSPVNVVATRAGSHPGWHTVGFDGPADAVTLSHAVRDRAVFARGALEAARWVRGRRGWFTMRDVLGLPADPAGE